MPPALEEWLSWPPHWPLFSVWQDALSKVLSLSVPPFPRPQVPGFDWSVWLLFKGTKPSPACSQVQNPQGLAWDLAQHVPSKILLQGASLV